MAGEDAAYGTVAHAVAAEWLTAIRSCDYTWASGSVLGRVFDENGFAITVDADMLHHIKQYIDWCHEVEILGDVYIEQRVDYSEYTPIPQQGGTADHFVCQMGVLTITDLKMGIGIPVFAPWNSQAMLYAFGVFLEWDWLYGFKKIIIRICQPRRDYFGVWECTSEELLAFGERVRIAADAAWVENAPRSPSPKACQWCADLGCLARSALLADLVDDAFDDESPEYDTAALENHAIAAGIGRTPNPTFDRKTETALMAWRYGHRLMYEKYFREIGEELLSRAQKGESVPGWKITAGRRSYKWLDDDDAAAELSMAGLSEKDIFHTEVTSVAQATKALRAAGISVERVKTLFHGETKQVGKRMVVNKGLVLVGGGRPTLVADTDERQDTRDAVDDAFDDDNL